jgi:hypothetical protein
MPLPCDESSRAKETVLSREDIVVAFGRNPEMVRKHDAAPDERSASDRVMLANQAVQDHLEAMARSDDLTKVPDTGSQSIEEMGSRTSIPEGDGMGIRVNCGR